MKKLSFIDLYRSILFLASLVTAGLFWNKPIIAFGIMGLLFIAINQSNRWQLIKTSLICSLLGPMAEAIAIACKSWTYARPAIAGVPFWLAPLWGIACIFFVSLADILYEKPRR